MMTTCRLSDIQLFKGCSGAGGNMPLPGGGVFNTERERYKLFIAYEKEPGGKI